MSVDGESRRLPLVEVGWVIVGPIEDLDRRAVCAARVRATAWLQKQLPEFRWSLPLSDGERSLEGTRVKPIRLIELGVFERDTKHWDFSFVVTGAELSSTSRRFALAATSRCEAVAVASTLRLDPAESRIVPNDAERGARMEARLVALFLRCLAALNGVTPRSEAPGDSPEELDQDSGCETLLARSVLRPLRVQLTRVADPRVEEDGIRPRMALSFYLKAVAADPWAVPSLVAVARPWLFPLRLSRMSAAALSILFVLLMTAEAWELGATRTLPQVLGFVCVVLVATSALVVSREGLLIRSAPRLTEQTALSNMATLCTVGLGFFCTFVFLLGVALLGAAFLFDGVVVDGWVHGGRAHVDGGQRLVFSVFAAGVGIVAGALGASFEETDYFQHIAWVDREL